MTMLMLGDALPDAVVTLSTLRIGDPRDATRDEAEAMGVLEESDSDGG